MSRKTVSRGAAAALATLLILASAAPSFATPRHAGGRGLTAQTGVWSFVVEFSQRLAGWAVGVDPGAKAPRPARGISEKVTWGSDPNGDHLTVDPMGPGGPVPVYPGFGGG